MNKFKAWGLAFLVVATSLGIQAGNDRKAFREARKACFVETGVTKPEKGQKLGKEDRKKIKACLSSKGISRPKMDEKTKAAFKECSASTGVKRPEKGQKPSKEDRAKMKACLEQKGVSWHHGKGKKNKSI